MKDIILGVDPGNIKSGIVILEESELVKGDHIENEKLFSLIDQYTLFDEQINLTVVYEDIRPYTSRFNMDTINTIKMIGRLEYVLKSRLINTIAIARNEVKNMVFKNYNKIALPDIIKKVEKSKNKKKDGSNRKPSFVYVDDRIVVKAMRCHWGIPFESGKKSKIGMANHAWQALAAVTFYISS